MKKKMRQKLVSMVLVAVMASTLFSGCGSNTAKEDAETITVYLWSNVMLNSFAPYIQEQLPDVNIEFVVGNNDLDFYKFMNEHGELPDIITCRRFSINDAAHMSNMLMDLSKTELAGTFYSSYLENNRESDGSIRWLPICAEVDGLSCYSFCIF